MNLAQIEQELRIKFKGMSKKDFEKFVERMRATYYKVHHINYDNNEEVEEKHCDNCKFVDVYPLHEPCIHCYEYDNWQEGEAKE